MIPKNINYCWFGRNELPPLAKNALKVGKNTARVTKLFDGMKATLMLNLYLCM